MKNKTQARYKIWIDTSDMEDLLTQHTLRIENNNHHYMMHVIRLKENDSIECIARNGIVATARVYKQMRSYTELTLVHHYSKTPPPYRIIIALGASKQLRRSFLLEKCVELRVHEVWIWRGERSQVDAIIKESWYDIFYNAATQCGNPFIPELRSFSSLHAMIAYAEEEKTNQLCFYEDSEYTQTSSLEDWNASLKPLVLIIGCEGGFSSNELTLLQKKSIPLRSLGSSILRYETAALVVCSIALMMNDSKGIPL